MSNLFVVAMLFPMFLCAMEGCAPAHDRLLAIPLVEYARDEQCADPYLYKGLPPQNYVAKVTLSVVECCEAFKLLQHFKKSQENSHGYQTSLGVLAEYETFFSYMLPWLPSGKKSASYIGGVLLPLARQVVYMDKKFCIGDTSEQLVDALIDLDFLLFDRIKLQEFLNWAQTEYDFLNTPKLQVSEEAKSKLRHLGSIIGKKLASDLFAEELKRIVDIRNSSNDVWSRCHKEGKEMECWYKTLSHRKVLCIPELQQKYGFFELHGNDFVDIPQLDIKISEQDSANLAKLKGANELRAIKYQIIESCIEKKCFINSWILGAWLLAQALAIGFVFFDLNIGFPCFMLVIDGMIIKHIMPDNRLTISFANPHCFARYQLLNWYKPHTIQKV